MKYKKTPCLDGHGVFLCTNCGIEPQVPGFKQQLALKVLVATNRFKPKVLVSSNTFIIYR